MFVVVYTFDVLTDPREGRPSLTSNGNGELTMLRHSIRSVLSGWSEHFASGRVRIDVYTTTPTPLSLVLLDPILRGHLKLRSLAKAAQGATSSASFGDNAATLDQEKFRAGGAGHARVWLIPHILSAEGADVLYCDNDTVLRSSTAAAFWSRLQHLRSAERCLAYECERGSCVSLLGPAHTDVRALLHSIVSPEKVDPDRVRVVNNGVQFFPACSSGKRIAALVRNAYTSMSVDSVQRYLHDMIALSWVWHVHVACCGTLLPADGPPPIVHYWQSKTKPEMQCSFLRTLVRWRVEEDVALLLSDAAKSLSKRQFEELVRRVEVCATDDARGLLRAATRNGVFLRRGDDRHLSKRSALRGTARRRHPGLQPTSARLVAATDGARARLRDMLG